MMPNAYFVGGNLISLACINPNHIDASATGDDGTKVPSLFKLLGGLPTNDARQPVVKNLKVC